MSEVDVSQLMKKSGGYNNPKNRPKKVAEMDAPVSPRVVSSSNSSGMSTYVRIRKRKKKKAEASVAPLSIHAQPDPKMMKILNETEVLMQDPPDRDETFVHHDLTPSAAR